VGVLHLLALLAKSRVSGDATRVLLLVVRQLNHSFRVGKPPVGCPCKT
jgi:hypothetical protein